MVQKKQFESSFKTIAIVSIIPIGLYAFSKHKKYNAEKTINVTTIGTLVILPVAILGFYWYSFRGKEILKGIASGNFQSKKIKEIGTPKERQNPIKINT